MRIRELYNKLISFFQASKPVSLDIKPVIFPTKIRVRVGNNVIGAIQSLSIQEKRNPDGYISVTAKINRIRFDKMRIAEAFSRGFLHVNSQRYPFDIEIEDENLTTTLKNVWITSLDCTYSASDWIITDYMEVEAETIYSVKYN